MPHSAADRAKARAVVRAYRNYLRTGRLARGVRQCESTHPDVGAPCILLHGHPPRAQHRDGPSHLDTTRRW